MTILEYFLSFNQDKSFGEYQRFNMYSTIRHEFLQSKSHFYLYSILSDDFTCLTSVALKKRKSVCRRGEKLVSWNLRPPECILLQAYWTKEKYWRTKKVSVGGSCQAGLIVTVQICDGRELFSVSTAGSRWKEWMAALDEGWLIPNPLCRILKMRFPSPTEWGEFRMFI